MIHCILALQQKHANDHFENMYYRPSFVCTFGHFLFISYIVPIIKQGANMKNPESNGAKQMKKILMLKTNIKKTLQRKTNRLTYLNETEFKKGGS